MGGRSRVAAQMLTGRGFNKVYNLSGGIKAWNGKTAVGPEDLGLELFTGDESLQHTLIVAYSLEQGLRDFYLAMLAEVQNNQSRDLFKKLAEIEIKHQERIFAEYLKVTEEQIDQAKFEQSIVIRAVEGGLSTGEFIRLYRPDTESGEEVVALAMAIEAQALDLYLRAADRTGDPASGKVLTQIAAEEQTHLRLLGELLDESKPRENGH